MATISVGSAVTGGFSLIRREPVAVAIWAVLLLGFSVLRLLIYLPFYGALAAQMGQTGGAPNIQALLPQIQQAQALGLLLGIVGLALNTALACAVFRAILRPEDRGFAYLKFGSAELFLFIFTIGAVIVFSIGLLMLLIPIGIVIGIAAAASGNGGAAGASIVVLIGMLFVFAIMIYFALRLSLLGPLMVDENEFRIGEAWALTHGKVGSLFLIGFMLFVMLVVAELVTFGVGTAVLFASVGGIGNLSGAFLQSGSAILAHFAPVIAVVGLLFAVLIAVFLPVAFAPWALAYRDLKKVDLAAAFN
jgi:hypothetical protein